MRILITHISTQDILPSYHPDTQHHGFTDAQPLNINVKSHTATTILTPTLAQLATGSHKKH